MRPTTSSGLTRRQRGGLPHAGVLLGEIGARALGGQGLDAAHAGGGCGFSDDLDEADVAGTPHMRAAAQLDRPGLVGTGLSVSHRDDTDFVAVLFAEQGHGAGLHGVLDRHQARFDGGVLQDDGVGEALDLRDVLGAHGLGVREVEAQAVGRDHRALLGDVSAEHLAQRLVQEMGRGVVGARRRAAAVIDDQLGEITSFERTLLDRADVDHEIAELLLRFGDAERGAARSDQAMVSDLAAGLAIKGRLVENDGAAVAGL